MHSATSEGVNSSALQADGASPGTREADSGPHGISSASDSAGQGPGAGQAQASSAPTRDTAGSPNPAGEGASASENGGRPRASVTGRRITLERHSAQGVSTITFSVPEGSRGAVQLVLPERYRIGEWIGECQPGHADVDEN